MKSGATATIALAAFVGLAVLGVGITLGLSEFDGPGLAVLVLVCAGAIAAVVGLSGDPVLGAALAISAFLPYARALGLEVRASALIPPLLLALAAAVSVRRTGVPAYLHRAPIVRWTLFYVLAVLVSTVVNQGRLSVDSMPFLALWMSTQLYFLACVLYRPKASRASQIPRFVQLSRVIVTIAVVALAVGVIEYRWPRSVEAFFAPVSRVEFWGARGAFGDWIIPLRRTGSVVGSPNAFGAVLAVGALLALGPAVLPRLLRVPTALLLSTGIVLLATSRGATMGVLSGVAVLAVTSRHRWWVVPLLAGVVAAATLMPSSVEFISSGYVPEGAALARGVPAAAERLFVWQRSLESFGSGSSLLVGSGPVNAAFLARTGLRGGHNLLVTNLAFFGLLGAFSVVGLCVAVVRSIRRRWREDETRLVARTVLSVVTGLLVHSLVDDMLFYNTSVMLLVFPLLAVLVRIDRGPGESGRASDRRALGVPAPGD